MKSKKSKVKSKKFGSSHRLRRFEQYSSNEVRSINQSGIAQMLVVFLLLAGIALGTYLVQQRTNILPKAEEQVAGGNCPYDQFCDPTGGDSPSAGYKQTCDGTWQYSNPDDTNSGLVCKFDESRNANCGACTPIDNGNNPPPSDNPQPSGNGTQPANTHVCSQDEADTGLPPQSCKVDSCSGNKYHHFVSWTDNNSNTKKDSGDTFYCNYTECEDLTCPQGATPPAGYTAHTCYDEGLVYCENHRAIQKSNARWNNQSQKCEYDFTDVTNKTSPPNQCEGKGDDSIIQAGSAKTIYSTGGTVTGGTNPCRDNPATPPSGFQWVADCDKSCGANSDCPANQTLDSSSQEKSRWCYGFDQGQRCMMLKQGSTLACNASQATSSYYDAKIATNLAFYEAIIRGTQNTCVKADLGLPQRIEAHALNGKPDARRLFLCGGVNNKPGSLDLTWRVVSDDGQTLVLTKEDFPLNPSDPNWPNKTQVEMARKLLGVTIQ